MPPQPQQAPGAPASGGTDGQAPTGTQPQNQQAPTGTESGTQPTQPAKTDLSTLPDDVRKIIDDARAGEARYRTEGQAAKQAAAAEQAKLTKVLAALGIKADGTEADRDPTELTAAIEQAQNAVWSTAVENTLLRLKDVDAERLLDSRKFIDSLDEFTSDDPHSPEFKTKLAAHVTSYVEQNPTFKADTGPPSSGGELGKSGEQGNNQRSKSLSEAVSRAISR